MTERTPARGDGPSVRFVDTADGRLAAWGCSLRLEPDGRWVAVIPRPVRPDRYEEPVAHDEVVIPGRSKHRPPAEAVRLLAPLTRGAPMATAGPAAGLADPRTAGPAPFGAPALDDDVVHRTSARDVIRASIVRSVEILLLDLPAARLGDDPEGVHQARVATRRLRSDLRTFQPMLDDGWVRSLRSELRRLADALGAVRDTDVLVVRLGRTLDELSDVDPAAGSRLVDALERERDEHRGRLRALLDEPDTIALYDHLVAAAADPRTIGRALGRADHRLAPLVRRPWRNLERAVEALDDDPSVDDLHRVRLLAKRVRYAAEAVAPAIGRPAERFAADVTRIQDVLGELNDDRVMADWLTGIAPHLDPPAAFVAGRAAQLTNDRAAVRRDEWVDAYRRAARPRRRAWFG